MSPAKVTWVTAVVIWASLVATVGPKLGETIAAKLWPPVVGLRLLELSQDAENVTFRIVGTKRTSDVLSTITASWVFPDTTIMPAALIATDGLGGPAGRPAGPFVSRTYSVRVTAAARTAAGTDLRLCLVYPAVGIYCVAAPYAAFPAVGPS